MLRYRPGATALASLLSWACAEPSAKAPLTEPPSSASTSSTTPAPDTADSGSGPTTTTPYCDAVYERHWVELCADTTAEQLPWGPDLYYLDDADGTGTVVTIGGALSPIDGSMPVNGFAPCGEEYPHQVRLQDEDGDVWTLGWDVLDSDVEAGGLAAVSVGQTLAFYGMFRRSTWSVQGGISLIDGDRPLFLLDVAGGLVGRAGGIDVAYDWDTYCVEPGTYDLRHITATFTSEGQSTELYTWQSAEVPVPGGSLEVLQGSAYYDPWVADGGSAVWWAAW